MVTSLAEALNNAQDAYDARVIQKFMLNSALLESLPFIDAAALGGGGVFSYSYRRQVTEVAAATRAIGVDFVASEPTTAKVTVECAVLGHKFGVDRRTINIGSVNNGSDVISFNVNEGVKSTVRKFQDLVINGDVATEATGFDGLDKALTGSSTEITTDVDLSGAGTQDGSHKVLNWLDGLFSELDGQPTAVIANRALINVIRAAGRFTSQYVQSPVEGLGTVPGGRPIFRYQFGGVDLIDAGLKSGSANAVIPLVNGETDVYVVRSAEDGFAGVSGQGTPLVEVRLPNFAVDGEAIKSGAVEMGPVTVALKSTTAAAVHRSVKIA